MKSRVLNRVARVLDRGVVRRWARAADAAEATDLAGLERLRDQAWGLRRRLDRLLHVAEGRLALPRIGQDTIQRPLHADWVFRPELWRGPISPPGRSSIAGNTQFGNEVSLFHDCALSEITFRQVRNTGESDLAPFGIRFDVFRFSGSYLSLVLELPPEAAAGLKRRHLVRLNLTVETEKPLEIFARLNIRHGPNTEQIVREFQMDQAETQVEFDLGFSEINEKRVERLWVDLIFENPEMNQILLRDITMARRPRAEI